MAEATDLSLEMIGRLERGQTAPSFETISALASVLGVQSSALFGAEALAVEGDRGRYLDRIGRLLVQVPDKELRRVERVLIALLADDPTPR